MTVNVHPELPYATASMDMVDVTPTLRSDEDVQLSDEVAQALLTTRSLKRLSGIGSFGAISYVRRGNGRAPDRRRHNRREHSIGVAKLAESYALDVQMEEKHRKAFVCAALLHDVGHGPLSHTLEPVFKERFGINHHRATRDIFKGTPRFGSEIQEILNQFKVDCEEVLALIDGEEVGSHAVLFPRPSISIPRKALHAAVPSLVFGQRSTPRVPLFEGGPCRVVCPRMTLTNSGCSRTVYTGL